MMRIIAASLFVLTLSACGFKPIYATPDGAVAPVNREVAVARVSAPEEVHLYVVDALRERIVLAQGQTPKYNLHVRATEDAQRLAVQIDATVTRYNYRLRGSYQLVNLETGERIGGSARAVTSYNIVSSQYSTLYAENTAREKAARLLAENIERDIILRLNDPEAASEADAAEAIDDPAVIEEIGAPRDPFNGVNQPFVIEEEDPDQEDGLQE
jgi:LPS-assembly lipoprotein